MLIVTLEIDNKTAHGCSPTKFVEAFILKDVIKNEENKLENSYAIIEIKKIKQI